MSAKTIFLSTTKKYTLTLFVLLTTCILLPIMLVQVILAALVYYLGCLFKVPVLQQHGRDLAIAADRNMNTVWLGYPEETISSRLGRAMISGRPKWYVKHIFLPSVDFLATVFGDLPNHCRRSAAMPLSADLQYEIWKWYYPSRRI